MANAIQHMSGLTSWMLQRRLTIAGNALTQTADGQLIGAVRNTGGKIDAPSLPDSGIGSQIVWSNRSQWTCGCNGCCADAAQHFPSRCPGSADCLTDNAC